MARRAKAWSAPLVISALGLIVTFAVAATHSASLARERQLRFEAEAAEVRQDILAAADQTVSEFQAGVNFLAATHPGPPDQYREFFGRELGELAAGDPGVLVFEEHRGDELEALVARERAFGDDRFEVTTFFATTDELLIITRATQDVEVFGVPILGLDVSMAREPVLLDGVLDDGFKMSVVESGDLIGLVPAVDLDDVDDDLLADHAVLLIGAIVDGDGERTGFAVGLTSLSEYLQTTDNPELNVEIAVENIVGPVARRLATDAIALDDAELVDRHAVRTSSATWTITVWANDDYEPGVGVFRQLAIWGVGIGVTALAVLFAIWEDRIRRRITHTEGELARARELAVTDPLTGLLNRSGLIDAARSFPNRSAAALFFVDLDGFKSVNDSMGHAYGDEVLRRVGRHLQAIFRSTDLVGRLGGDEYVIFAVGPTDDAHVARLSERITAQVASADARISASLGIAIRPAGTGLDVKELLRTADEAMYEAKRSGGHGYRVRTAA